MKARKCIIKAGSLDKYLLNTKESEIDSKFGLLLREHIRNKMVDPEYEVPYIPGTAKVRNNKKTSVWEYKQIPAVYMPAKAKINDDQSKFYIKTPQEMSRFEISELERMLRELDEPDVYVPEEEVRASKEFKDLQEQMRMMQPIRHGLIRRFLERYKWQKRKRENLLAHIEKTEEGPKEVLGDEYVHFLDAMPEFKTFLEEVRVKEAIRQKEREALAALEEEGGLVKPKVDAENIPGEKKGGKALTKKAQPKKSGKKGASSKYIQDDDDQRDEYDQ